MWPAHVGAARSGSTPTVDDVVAVLRGALEEVAVADDREPMRAYMRGRFEFIGVKTPARRKATRRIVRSALAEADGDAAVALAQACWRQPEREFQYVGADALAAHVEALDAGHLGAVGGLITSKSWWDTVDALATGCVEPLVAANDALVSAMDEWIDDADMWLARTAILHQLKEGERTDPERLFRYCLRRADDERFFIRKAIGWALRQYARTDPGAVRRFVEHHRDTLSALTVREATKHL